MEQELGLLSGQYRTLREDRQMPGWRRAQYRLRERWELVIFRLVAKGLYAFPLDGQVKLQSPGRNLELTLLASTVL